MEAAGGARLARSGRQPTPAVKGVGEGKRVRRARAISARGTYHHRPCPAVEKGSVSRGFSGLTAARRPGGQAWRPGGEEKRGQEAYKEGEGLLELGDLLLGERVGLESVRVSGRWVEQCFARGGVSAATHHCCCLRWWGGVLREEGTGKACRWGCGGSRCGRGCKADGRLL